MATTATTATAAAVAAEEIAIAAIVFFLAEKAQLVRYFTSRTHSRRTVMNYERYL